MPSAYTKYQPYKLILDQWGTFTVKPGDCVSKYHWAVFGNWGDDQAWRKYFQQVLPGLNGGYILKPLQDPNRIDIGWRMTYIPDYNPPKTGTTPPENPGVGEPKKPATAPLVDLNKPGYTPIVGTVNFILDAKYPLNAIDAKPIFKGWVVGQLQGSIRGTVKLRGGGPATVSVSNGDLKVAIQCAVTKGLLPDSSLSYELNPSVRGNVLKAAQSGDYRKALVELASGIEQTWKTRAADIGGLGYIFVNGEFQIQVSILPLYAGLTFESWNFGPITASGAVLEAVALNGATGSVTTKFGANFAPGPEFWRWLLRFLGQYATRAFATSVAEDLVAALTSEGVLIAGVCTVGVFYALATSALAAWAYSNAWNEGNRIGLANTYATAFSWTVVGSTPIPPNLWDTGGRTVEERLENYNQQMTVMTKGVEDAKESARTRLQLENHPAASGPDKECLEYYWGFFMAEARGNQDAAQKMLTDAANAKALRILKQ